VPGRGAAPGIRTACARGLPAPHPGSEPRRLPHSAAVTVVVTAEGGGRRGGGQAFDVADPGLRRRGRPSGVPRRRRARPHRAYSRSVCAVTRTQADQEDAVPDDRGQPDPQESSVRGRLARLSARNPLGPSLGELLQNLAGEASADAAHAQLEAEAAEEAPRPPVPRDLTAAAFFDVDNTMVQGASIIHFARGLAARHYIELSDMAQFGWQQLKFRVTGKENSDDVASGKEKALSFIAGRETSEFVALGEQIYDEIIADKLWTGTLELARRHLAAGQQVWLVTATPQILAQVIARRLGFTGALG